MVFFLSMCLAKVFAPCLETLSFRIRSLTYVLFCTMEEVPLTCYSFIFVEVLAIDTFKSFKICALVVHHNEVGVPNVVRLSKVISQGFIESIEEDFNIIRVLTRRVHHSKHNHHPHCRMKNSQSK